ncbi:PilZ domain-containing protein, partial [Candidatus Latescibacterota bacterium]
MLAAYVYFDELDMTNVYLLFAAIVVVFLVMMVFRGMSRVKENRQVQRSSWRTFEKVARVRGLSAAESRALAEMVRRCRVKRPTQVLGSIQLFDRCLDQAVDRGYVGEVDQSLLEAARSRLVSTAQGVWDGHQDRRQFARAESGFEVGAVVVTKEDLDEELRTSYQENDAQFLRGLETVVGKSSPQGGHVKNLSAGGMALRTPETPDAKEGDYVSLSMADQGGPVNVGGMVGKILGLERVE